MKKRKELSQYIHLKNARLSWLVLCLCIASLGTAYGQLNADGDLHTINHTGSYQQFQIPTAANLNGNNYLTFILKGADGGKYPGTFNDKKGGGGATVRVSFELGTGSGQLQPGGTVRFIVGKKGEHAKYGGVAGGGGGGGTAVLYREPDATMTCSDPSTDLTDAGSCWVILGAAGAGGGAFASDIVGTGSRGKGGNDGECGTDGGDFNGGNGRCNGNGGQKGGDEEGGAGGGALTAGSNSSLNGGQKGGFNGGDGADRQVSDDARGGYGYGGGGLGRYGSIASGINGAGGGGGGYSGGGGGKDGEGGGGGSFANSSASSSEKIQGGSDNTPDNGVAYYEFSETNPGNPVAKCKNISITLNTGSNSYTLDPSEIDNGSTVEPGETMGLFLVKIINIAGTKLKLPIPDSTLYCNNIGEIPITLWVASSSGKKSLCTSIVEILDDTAPTVSCTASTITASLNGDGEYALPFSAIETSASDACGSIVEKYLSQDTFRCADLGVHTVYLTAVDNSGNSGQCTATLFLENTVQVVAVCQDITVELDATGSVFVTADELDGGSTGNCTLSWFGSYTDCSGGPCFDYSLPITFNCSNVGSYLINLTLSNSLGQSDNCTATITIVPYSGNTRWYVDASKTTSGGGMSWSCASKTLQQALLYADSGDEIWVTDGVYYPDEGPGTTNNDRNARFNLKSGVAIYGGFSGNETMLSQRDWTANVARLSGDLMKNDGPNFANNGDNAYHVVYADDAAISATAILDGFTVTAGNVPNGPGGGMSLRSGSSPSIQNCIFSKNSALLGGGVHADNSAPVFTSCTFTENESAGAVGGGAYFENMADVALADCEFRGNTAPNLGGGMSISSANTTLTNCIFSGNKANDGGGGLYIHNSASYSTTLVNCSFSGNMANSGSGGAIRNNTSTTLSLSNCILWGNSSSIRNVAGGSSTVDYSIIEGGHAGTGNLDVDPLFVSQPDHTTAPTTAGDLHLQPCSPAIDAGSNAGAPANDLDGNTRPFAATDVDMGAYEFQGLRPAPVALCQNQTVHLDAGGSVSLDVSLLDDGSSGCAPLSFKVDEQSTLNFSCADVGTTGYELVVTDAFGATITCSVTITVADDLFPCNTTISGTVIWEHDGASAVKDASIALSGDDNNVALTPVDGSYTLTASSGSNFTVTPSKNINKLNGITVADATAIQQHVTQSNPITDPYKQVAADVNKSNSISTFDATVLNQALLGNPAAMAQFKTSWRFVPQSYTLPLPPWGFPEKITLTGINGSVSGQDFFGIKTGDVADTYANPANFGGPRSDLVLRSMDQRLQAGETIEMTFNADQLDDLAAFQFALHFPPDQLQFTGLQAESPLLFTNDHLGLYNIEKGEIRVVWSQALGLLIEEGTPVFRLRFSALKGGAKLSEILQLDETVLPALAYNSALAESKVSLRFNQLSGTTDPTKVNGLALYNQPNPFVQSTTISFMLPGSCDAQLRVLDVGGRELLRINKSYPAGYQEETIRLEGASGVLFCELLTPFGASTLKVIAVER